MQQRGILSELLVKSIIFKHSGNIPALEYKDEMNYIVSHEKRNKFICSIPEVAKGNTLILYELVGKHGKPLFKMMKEKYPDRDIFIVNGEIKAKEREEIRKSVEHKNNCIVIASYKTFQEGINIKKLHNVVFASPSKSKIRVFQSIGRGLRTHSSKNKAILYDLADDMRSGRKQLNYTLKHFKERIEMYSKEEFKIKYIEMEL